jgi:hypothetical protein
MVARYKHAPAYWSIRTKDPAPFTTLRWRIWLISKLGVLAAVARRISIRGRKDTLPEFPKFCLAAVGRSFPRLQGSAPFLDQSCTNLLPPKAGNSFI